MRTREAFAEVGSLAHACVDLDRTPHARRQASLFRDLGGVERQGPAVSLHGVPTGLTESASVNTS
eukprot:1018606-Pyramimonas_sp.AAC.1